MASATHHAAEKAGSFLAISVLVVFGLLTGIALWAYALDPLFARVHFFEGLISVGLFSVVIAVTGLIFIVDVWRGTEIDDLPTSGPPVQAIIPAYRDANVVDESVTSLLESDYDPLRIAVVVEPDDEATLARAEELADRHESVECVVSDDPGSKATAINCAVRRSPADYFVVFDADERASEEFVPIAMNALQGETDVFQGRRVPRPTGAIETLAYCERIVVQAGYLIGELVGFTHCQSSATGFTRDAIESVGGYADVLTEDIYFSHQCYQADLTVTQNRCCTSTMEAPHTLQDLWAQRKRWRIGHVQVAHLRIREAFKDGFGLGDAVTVGRAVGTVIAGAALVILAVHVLFLFLVDTGAALVPFTTIFGMIGGIWARDTQAGRIGLPSWSFLLSPLVYLGHGVLTVKALLEYLLTWEGEWYQVSKTGS